MLIPSHLKNFTADYKEKGAINSANIIDSQGGRLFEIWYYGEFLDKELLNINNLKYPCIVSTDFSVLKIIAKSVKTGEEILLFDRAVHGYNAMFCNRFSKAEIENRPLKKLDILPSEIKIDFWYEIDLDYEKNDYDFNENGDCILLNGKAMPWEEVKSNGMDYIALYYKKSKNGRWIEFAEDEL
ncbi:MAG: hypothetical protein K2O36_03975 [Ruminococcus sp.]|nr:hypothetical protein [Ruminococcus sp.]MDE7105019.1 hypothetical protein [Ruminococcus sp.]